MKYFNRLNAVANEFIELQKQLNEKPKHHDHQEVSPFYTLNSLLLWLVKSFFFVEDLRWQCTCLFFVLIGMDSTVQCSCTFVSKCCFL